MLGLRHQLKVLQAVVQTIAVHVMDLAALWNRTMRPLPHNPVLEPLTKIRIHHPAITALHMTVSTRSPAPPTATIPRMTNRGGQAREAQLRGRVGFHRRLLPISQGVGVRAVDRAGRGHKMLGCRQ